MKTSMKLMVHIYKNSRSNIISHNLKINCSKILELLPKINYIKIATKNKI